MIRTAKYTKHERKGSVLIEVSLHAHLEKKKTRNKQKLAVWENLQLGPCQQCHADIGGGEFVLPGMGYGWRCACVEMAACDVARYCPSLSSRCGQQCWRRVRVVRAPQSPPPSRTNVVNLVMSFSKVCCKRGKRGRCPGVFFKHERR